MSLLSLPPELLAVIIAHLDTKSVYNLYGAGVRCLQGLVTECHFSLSALATAKSLETDFFTGVAGYLRVLNLRGVSDLQLPTLTTALTSLRSLTDLDVSYTNINMHHFLPIVEVRPTLKSIAIDFTFGDHLERDTIMSLLKEYQKAFEGFESVCLIQQAHKDFLELLVCMLQHVDLSNLKLEYTRHRLNVSRWIAEEPFDWDKIVMVRTSQLQVHFLNPPHNVLCKSIYCKIDFKKYEIIIFNHRHSTPAAVSKTVVVATPLLKKYIHEHFNARVEDLSESDYSPRVYNSDIKRHLNDCLSNGESVFMFWERERTIFDGKFYSKLSTVLKEYLVYDLDTCSAPVPAPSKWHAVAKFVGAPAGRKQVVEMDYSDAFKEKQDVKLNVLAMYDDSDPREGRPAPELAIYNIGFVSKLSHLSLSTNMVYHCDFFKNLFVFGKSLVTLQLIVDMESDPNDYFNFVKESKSLKNLLIDAAGIDLPALFACLSECRTLENVHLVNYGLADAIPDPTDLFKSCDNLYYFYICTYFSHPHTREEMLSFYEKVKLDLSKHALRVHVISYDSKASKNVTYHPCLSVFDLYKLKPM